MSERPSPLPNRVTPFGAIVAEPWRGTLMGNRGGRIHEGWHIARPWASRQWIACVLEFRGRQREVMRSGYTELFFLDEVSAMAAGHRPCFECRRADALRFAAAWAAAAGVDPRTVRAPEMDRVLHAERVPLLREPGTRPRAQLEALPGGAMVAHGGRAYLWWQGRLRPWSGEGYGDPEPDTGREFALLTPPTLVGVLAAGYAPLVHPSADGGRPA